MAPRPATRPLPPSSAAAEGARGLVAGALFGAACLTCFSTTLQDAWWALVQAALAVAG